MRNAPAGDKSTSFDCIVILNDIKLIIFSFSARAPPSPSAPMASFLVFRTRRERFVFHSIMSRTLLGLSAAFPIAAVVRLRSDQFNHHFNKNQEQAFYGCPVQSIKSTIAIQKKSISAAQKTKAEIERESEPKQIQFIALVTKCPAVSWH